MAHWEETAVAGQPLRIFTGAPPKTGKWDVGPHPACLLCRHAPGLEAFTERVMDRLADNGFASMATDFFHRTGADHPEQRDKVMDAGFRTVRVVTDTPPDGGRMDGATTPRADRHLR